MRPKGDVGTMHDACTFEGQVHACVGRCKCARGVVYVGMGYGVSTRVERCVSARVTVHMCTRHGFVARA